MQMKLDFRFVITGLVLTGIVVLLLLGWGKLAGIIGAVSASLFAVFGGGGKKVVEGVKKRAKLKAEDVPDTDPHAVVDDINKRISD